MRRIKGKIKYILIMCLCALCLFIFGCDTAMQQKKDKDIVKIRIVDSPFITLDSSMLSVKRGSNITISLSFVEGRLFKSCSYSDYLFSESENGAGTLLLKNVLYPCSIIIMTSLAELYTTAIRYNLNGGNFISSSKDENSYIERYDISIRPRVNTSHGISLIERDGYVLKGWNTKSDYSGEHIGLGSRVTVHEEETIDLYAEWAQCMDTSQFTYLKEDEGITLKTYLGLKRITNFVLPRLVAGLPVLSVSTGFAVGVEAISLIFPDTLQKVENNAFQNCNIKNLYFFENLTEVSDESFGYRNFSHWYLNATRMPIYLKSNEIAQFAENMDRLILHQNEKKMIFFAGCSMAYGLKSERIDQVYGDEYVTMNMGVVGGTDAGFQFDCITKFIGPQDIFIHAPEVASEYQLMYMPQGTSIGTSLIFVMIEGNYDLLSYADLSYTKEMFNSFADFIYTKVRALPGAYTDKLDCYNEYGDISYERKYTDEDVSYSNYQYYYELNYINTDSVNALCYKYDAIRDKGGEVYISFSPVNRAGLAQQPDLIWLDFERLYIEKLEERDYDVISNIEDYLMEGKYFYNEDYHLNDIGATIRTDQLIADLQAAGI